MGWTHYWERSTALPKGPFAAAVGDCRTALERTNVPLAGSDGDDVPTLTPERIAFNGADKARCERFEIHQTEFDRRGRSPFWSFCKTEHLPYDLCVQTALIVLSHHLGRAIRIGSDGKDDDWAEARRICQQHLGYGEDFRLNSSA